MNALMDWGINIILWLQQMHPALDGIFEALTFIGGEEFVMLLLPLVYWCIDASIGRNLVVLFLINAYTNTLGKALAHQPRPFSYDNRVWAYSEVGHTGGFPSGHTQTTTVLWSFLVSQFRERWLWIVAGLMMVLVPLSRVYLGVHFPHDLWGGYVLGGALVFAYLTWGSAIAQWFGALKSVWQYALVVSVSLLIAVTLPTENGVATAATLMGGGIGLLLEMRYIRFSATGTWVQRVGRFVLGLIVLLAIWGGLRAAFSDLHPMLIFRFIRYSLMGLWLSGGAPWLFVKLRLTEQENS